MVRSIRPRDNLPNSGRGFFTLARHVGIDQLRRDRLPDFHSFSIQHASIAEPKGVVDPENLDALRHAFNGPSAKGRASRWFRTDMGDKEISAILSINIAAAKARVHQLRQNLREHYE